MLPRLPLQRILARTLCARPIPSCRRRHASNFGSAPGPPKLPAQEQAEFERLQRQAAVSSAFQPEAAAASGTSSAAADAATRATTSTSSAAVDAELSEGGGLYRGAKPEFDGDRNPRTGEVGGPKNEPLRWGSGGDWSYNGKVTDF
ncbi:hypothetical protein LLEC1_05895 [Akanthomyces lecanii]|uniref:Succinate dehydrogenase assembly factor 4, mitochondrial n=1 Tax=Cordyceps confragosa TaxID=2714763 RepID=A0A179IDD7_CORDF|nr:hypothetical protein LLEC1_05895 [Akanthomyces lecanii]